MKFFGLIPALLAMNLMGASLYAAPQTGGAKSTLESTAGDSKAIQAVLDEYVRCVKASDEAGFRALLLNDNIPFSAVSASAPASIGSINEKG